MKKFLLSFAAVRTPAGFTRKASEAMRSCANALMQSR